MTVLAPRDLGIILSYYCNSGCKHCLYNCGPRWERESMSSADLAAALDAVTTWPDPPQVHFTGGEPFLFFSLLERGVEMAAARGIACYAETSASWCLDEAQAVERFGTLREGGLQAVLISCSAFHAERIPPARTLRAVRAALAVFGPNRVIVYLPEHLQMIQGLEQDRPTPLEWYVERYGLEGARRILWQGYGIISGGRAGFRLGHLVPRYDPERFEGSTCAGDLLYAQHSHFDLYGNYISGFCGGLAVGSWRELHGVRKAFLSGRYPQVVGMLIDQGPYGLYRWAAVEHGFKADPSGYSGKCHLCVDVRRHLHELDAFDELRPAAFYEMI
jgi:hypothetical protein